MSTPFISIIAPVYNIDKYVGAFIKSVLSQTYTNWELILIDDGSTDNSGKICDDFSSQDNRIKVIHQLNGGVSKARNAGIKQSKGDWMMMSDPDDLLLPDGLASLIDCIDGDIDLISASYIRHVNGVEEKEGRKKSITSKMSKEQYIEEIGISPRSRNLDRYLWNKMFRASVIKDNGLSLYEDLHLFEDVCFIYQYLAVCKQKIYCLAKPFYSYFRKTEGTAMTNRRHYQTKTPDWLLAYTRIYETVKDMNVSDTVKERMKEEVFAVHRCIIGLIRKDGLSKREEKKADALLRHCFSYPTIVMYNCKDFAYSALIKGKNRIHQLIH